VVEIFPRLLTRAVVKSSRAARAGYLADIALPPGLHADAEASEDAFDASLSALAMERGFGPLAEEPDYALEGKIWTPDEVRSATRAMDFKRAKRFVDAVPHGRWTAYKDVAIVAGNPRGAQAVGNWIRREGHRMPTCYRVLTVDGQVPDAFRPAGAGLPRDAAHVREVLRAEGLRIDAAGFASKAQRFTADHWP
jgi:alkylated DNA nucleotide flippase Atl1